MTPDTEMRQRTVGSVEHEGITYDIDWRFKQGANGEIIECEGAAFVFIGDDQIIEFCNPDWDQNGWGSIDALMDDARRYICDGIMEQCIRDRPSLVRDFIEAIARDREEKGNQ